MILRDCNPTQITKTQNLISDTLFFIIRDPSILNPQNAPFCINRTASPSHSHLCSPYLVDSEPTYAHILSMWKTSLVKIGFYIACSPVIKECHYQTKCTKSKEYKYSRPNLFVIVYISSQYIYLAVNNEYELREKNV